MVLPQRNLLSEEVSPYLRQHADNPVHWRPWGKAALEEAKALNRPILLSIGYAACHWCHVMAHESFEDDDVADIMNRLFINIKVDREERPEIDQIYLSALSSMGEQGGWPLTMFLTPDAKPFWGGTYFPKEQKYGRPGFASVLTAVHKAWTDKSEQIQESADALSIHVQTELSPLIEAGRHTIEISKLAQQISSFFDKNNGGFGGAPKFPNMPMLYLLWLDWLMAGNQNHRNDVILTLSKMMQGGIYDHLGGGFARYTVDDRWIVPHFEKMLYDNAQFIHLGSLVYTETKDKYLLSAICETVEWIIREMQVEDGAYTSSLDADSQGKEGQFYLWTKQEVEEVLEGQSDLFFSNYILSKPEEWEGDPILHRRFDLPEMSATEELSLQNSRERLFHHRSFRPRPSQDKKILVDWNGLTIEAITIAARILKKDEWLNSAKTAFFFIHGHMTNGQLPHSIMDGEYQFPGLSSDYAAMINASVALYETTGDENFITIANEWAHILETEYIDEKESGFYLTSLSAQDVPMRIRGDIDDAMQSATAQIILALSRLATITNNIRLQQTSLDTAHSAYSRAVTQRHGQSGIFYAAAIAENQQKLMIYDPHPAEDFITVANQNIHPYRVDVILDTKPSAWERSLDIVLSREKPAAWLCRGTTCQAPVFDSAELAAALSARADPIYTE